MRVKLKSSAVASTAIYMLSATTLLANECLYWAEIAEKHYNMPEGLMRAIILHESKARPNTLNVDGKSIYYGSKLEAAYGIQALTPKSYSVDVGCSQITIKWHGNQFHNIGEMLDPRVNVSYGSHLLNNLKIQRGTWTEAVKHYHSKNSDKNNSYACKIKLEMMRKNWNYNVIAQQC